METNKLDVKKEKGENYLIKNDKVVKVIKYDASGDIEIQDTLNKSNTFSNVKKISKHEYVVLDTGEIRYYKSGTNKSQNDLRRSMKKLNQILRNNFTGAGNELYITLTTERDVTNIREIKEKFQQWWSIMKGEFKDLEFVAVYEKHTDRDSWHIHTMIKAKEHKRLYIANNFIEEIWRYGFAKTNRIINTPTFNDIREDYRMVYRNKITERFGIDKVINYMCKTETKKEIPTGERCYDTSKGIKRPETESIRYDETRNQMGQDYKLATQYTSIIRNAETDAILNKVKRETWKKI